MTTAAGGTHPTGMHSCSLCKRLCTVNFRMCPLGRASPPVRHQSSVIPVEEVEPKERQTGKELTTEETSWFSETKKIMGSGRGGRCFFSSLTFLFL